MSVDKAWQRLGIDITHFRGHHFLTVIDHGPSRYTVWRNLRIQSALCVKQQLEAIFFERGAPEELLLDNDTAFRGREFRSFAAQWQISLRFRCAYRPSGNGITERCHRTVKAIAAKKSCSIPEAVYIYNVTPVDSTDPLSSPAELLFKYNVRIRGVDPEKVIPENNACRYKVGDCVWVRPPGVRCDERYDKGVVTKVISENSVEVGGMPRHVRDLRLRQPEGDGAAGADTVEPEEMIVTVERDVSVERDDNIGSNGGNEVEPLRRSERARRLPLRYRD